MGTSQSSPEGGSSAGAGASSAAKTSYYELLGIARHADEAEIKKAYRRKALELHPDRNYGNEAAATQTFAEVQAAYEVLSDPQERAWYDSHESAILRGDDPTADGGAGGDAPVYENVRLTTADDLARLVRKFSTNVAFTDAPTGFFGFVRETFEHLAMEEAVAARMASEESAVDARDYPSFGHAADEYADVVKAFYSAWNGFATIKTFAWKDKWRLSEAPDRWTRRRMEAENKAARTEARKEFNEAVRALVAFVRKRDPRYVPSSQSEAERQQALRDAAAAQAARARAANQARLEAEEVPEWTKIREPEELEESDGEEEEVVEVLECVACNKVFKSERQWEAHERSKKHQKAMFALRKKMRKENAHLDLDGLEGGSEDSGAVTPHVTDDEELLLRVEEDELLHDIAAEVGLHTAETNGHESTDEKDLDISQRSDKENEVSSLTTQQLDHTQAADHQSDDDSDDSSSLSTLATNLESHTLSEADTVATETNPRNEVSGSNPTNDFDDTNDYDESDDTNDYDESDDTNHSNAPKTTSQPTNPHPPSTSSDPTSKSTQKLGKAKQKRVKRAAAAAAANDEMEGPNAGLQCANCQATFPSKNRLFQHIKDHGHAALKSGNSSSAGKKKKGKR